MKAIAFAIAAVLILALSASHAAAERIVISLSTHIVRITSNFTGAELLLFGVVERDAATVARKGGYDIVVTVIGPRQDLVTFRKERVAGLWINTRSRVFVDAPSYLAALSNRPVEAITDAALRRRLQLGLSNMVLPQKIGGDIADVTQDDPFRMAFLRLRREQGLYREEANAVTFLTPSLFRANIALPANVPTGSYEVHVALFADGTLLARQSSAIEIVKVGFEQFVADAARSQGALYGLATVTMALATGWLASVVFRRD